MRAPALRTRHVGAGHVQTGREVAGPPPASPLPFGPPAAAATCTVGPKAQLWLAARAVACSSLVLGRVHSSAWLSAALLEHTTSSGSTSSSPAPSGPLWLGKTSCRACPDRAKSPRVRVRPTASGVETLPILIIFCCNGGTPRPKYQAARGTNSNGDRLKTPDGARKSALVAAGLIVDICMEASCDAWRLKGSSASTASMPKRLSHLIRHIFFLRKPRRRRTALLVASALRREATSAPALFHAWSQSRRLVIFAPIPKFAKAASSAPSRFHFERGKHDGRPFSIY